MNKYRVFYITIFCLVFSVTLLSSSQAVQSAQNVKTEISASEISFDALTGQIKYKLPESALVRIRIGIKNGGPLLRTLIDWELRSKGNHTEIWDKKDASGKVDFGTRRDLICMLACLPATKTKHSAYSGAIRGLRKSPDFKIIFPESAKKDDLGVPIASGVTPIRVELERKDLKWLTDVRYEVVVFIDGIFIMEDEEGISPFTYRLDTKHLNDGLHIMTVNIASFEGEVGTYSALIKVKNQ